MCRMLCDVYLLRILFSMPMLSVLVVTNDGEK
jgi:hypothetical protein